MEENFYDDIFNRIKSFVAGQRDSFESDEIYNVKWVEVDDIHVSGVTFKEMEGGFLEIRTSVDADVDVEGKARYGYDHFAVTKTYNVFFQALLENGLQQVKITKVEEYNPNTYERDRSLSQNLVPYMYEEDVEKHAEDFLKRHYPKALLQPMAIPVEEIVQSMGMKMYYAPLEEGIFGKTYFGSEKVKVYTNILQKEIVEIVTEPGTMLINPDVYFMYNIGTANNTIIHDLVIEETPEEDEAFNDGVVSGPITKGSRNNTLSRFAGRVLKKYGECDKAHEVFLEQAEKCDPPLEDSELNTIWFSALKFFRNKVSKDSGYIPPEKYNNDFGDGAGSLKPEDYSDVGQAKVLSREYGDELKFTAATDFIRFDGEVWVEDKQMAVGACVEFLDLQLQDAKDSIEVAMKTLVDAGYDESVVKQGSKALAKEIQTEHLSLFYMLVGAEKYLAFAMKRRDYKYITSALNVAKSMLTIKVSDLDKDPVLLNTPRATYNLEKGIAGEQPHDPFDLITKITECSPGDEGMDIWLEALGYYGRAKA